MRYRTPQDAYGVDDLQRFPPRLRNAAQERTFLAGQVSGSLPLIRLALIVGLAIYLAFGLVDPLLYETHLATVYLLRFGVGAPAIAITLALTWAPAFHRWHQVILGTTIVIVSATLATQVMLEGQHEYYVGLILVMFFAYLFLRIRYLLASAIALAMVLACSLLAPVLNPVSTAIHVAHVFFLGGGFVVSSLIAYIHEFSARREYLQRLHIEAQQAELYALAYHDETTGLPNRHLFRDRLADTLGRAASRTPMAIAVLGVDRLKEINETYGRNGGEEMLAAVARRLQRAMPERATVARLEGGDFAVELGPLAELDTVSAAIVPLQRALAQPVTVANEPLTVRIHMGVSVYPDHGRHAEQLIQAATTAMNAARAAGPARCLTYSADMSTRVAEHLQLEEELREAARHRAFTLYYQPQLDLRTGETCGVEALLRWQHPRRGLLTPDEFLATLEESDLLSVVGHWTIEAALTQYRRWLRSGQGTHPIAVNLSPHQLHERDLIGRIDRAFAAVPVPPEALRIELTESTAMINPRQTARTLQRLRERGIESALDDFGKGYSSLSHLRHLPVSTIKIDKAFMADFPDDPDNRALLESIVTMTHHLGKFVLAEGVESEAQRAYLSSIGCDYAQGALIGMPAPANRAIATEAAGASDHKGASSTST